MLSFVTFESDGVEGDRYPPRHAFQIGPDEIPVQGAVRIERNVVFCEKQAPHAAAVALQAAVGPPPPAPGQPGLNIFGSPSGPLGLLTLQSCLLPERDGPYVLAVEVARHRIMLFLNKAEDWGLMDLPPDHPVMQEFERARQAFTESLVAQRGVANGTEVAAGTKASQAVALAINAGEGLALLQADRQLKGRLSGRSYQESVEHLARLTPETPPPGSAIVVPGAGGVSLPGRPAVGVSISPQQFSEGLHKAVLATCDFVSMPMRWADMEPVEGKYNFGPTDRWIEWAVRTAKLPITGGPLVDFRPRSVPDFLFIWENDYETLRDLVQEHVAAIVTRYRRTVSRWTVASGLHVNTNFKVSFEQIMDLTRMCVQVVRKLQPTAKVQLEIAQPWGEYHAANKRSIPPYLYAEAIAQSGLHVDALALRLQMGHAQPGLATRDLMSLSAILDRYAALEKPLVVSCLGCPSAPIPPTPYIPRAGVAPDEPYEPGWWRSPWSEATQADWLGAAMAICCSKPYVHSVCWQELTDGSWTTPQAAPEMPHGGLITATGQPKAALTRLAQFRGSIRDGKSPLALRF